MGYGPGGEKYGDFMENEIEEGKNIVGGKKNMDFQYIANERYIIEIREMEKGGGYYTKRIATLAEAVRVASDYNAHEGLTASILDTKTGEIL